VSDEATTIPSTTAAPHGATGLPYAAEELRTERLCLRPLNTGELDEAQSYQRARDVVRYLHWEVHDHEESAKRLRKRLAMNGLHQDGDGIVYAVELLDADGGHTRIIGHMSMFLKSAQWAQVELGWVFHPAIHGRGYATEATKRLLELACGTLGAHRVFAQLDARNEASARLCEIVGMRQEALLREREIKDDRWVDTAIYSLLEDEYRSAQ
jgi:RimJ/RimL family protein N-acetyltransferase